MRPLRRLVASGLAVTLTLAFTLTLASLSCFYLMLTLPHLTFLLPYPCPPLAVAWLARCDATLRCTCAAVRWRPAAARSASATPTLAPPSCAHRSTSSQRQRSSSSSGGREPPSATYACGIPRPRPRPLCGERRAAAPSAGRASTSLDASAAGARRPIACLALATSTDWSRRTCQLAGAVSMSESSPFARAHRSKSFKYGTIMVCFCEARTALSCTAVTQYEGVVARVLYSCTAVSARLYSVTGVY